MKFISQYCCYFEFFLCVISRLVVFYVDDVSLDGLFVDDDSPLDVPTRAPSLSQTVFTSPSDFGLDSSGLFQSFVCYYYQLFSIAVYIFSIIVCCVKLMIDCMFKFYCFLIIYWFFLFILVSITRVGRRSVLDNILGYASQDFGTDLVIGFEPNQEEIDFSFHKEVIFIYFFHIFLLILFRNILVYL